ncbi:hypothetical protein CN561_29195, partial [Bacillus toyonensis]
GDAVGEDADDVARGGAEVLVETDELDADEAWTRVDGHGLLLCKGAARRRTCSVRGGGQASSVAACCC